MSFFLEKETEVDFDFDYEAFMKKVENKEFPLENDNKKEKK